MLSRTESRAKSDRTVDGVAWREPWVFEGSDGRWHMLLTASAARWPDATVRLIGRAVSDELIAWKVLPPPAHRPGDAASRRRRRPVLGETDQARWPFC